MNTSVYQRFLNDVRPNDVRDDERVVAVRDRLAALQESHRAAAAAVEPLREAVAELPTHVADARSRLAHLEMQAASIATDVFLGAPEQAWRDYEDELAQCRALVRRLDLAGPELDRRLHQEHGPVRRLGEACSRASFELNEAIDAVRGEVATARMSR